MKKTILALVVASVAVTGCDYLKKNDNAHQSEQKIEQKIEQKAPAVESAPAIDQSTPIDTPIQNVTPTADNTKADLDKKYSTSNVADITADMTQFDLINKNHEQAFLSLQAELESLPNKDVSEVTVFTNKIKATSNEMRNQLMALSLRSSEVDALRNKSANVLELMNDILIDSAQFFSLKDPDESTVRTKLKVLEEKSTTLKAEATSLETAEKIVRNKMK